MHLSIEQDKAFFYERKPEGKQVESDIELDYDSSDESLIAWPNGSERSNICVGASRKSPRHHKIFRTPRDCHNAGFVPRASDFEMVEYTESEEAKERIKQAVWGLIRGDAAFSPETIASLAKQCPDYAHSCIHSNITGHDLARAKPRVFDVLLMALWLFQDAQTFVDSFGVHLDYDRTADLFLIDRLDVEPNAFSFATLQVVANRKHPTPLTVKAREVLAKRITAEAENR